MANSTLFSDGPKTLFLMSFPHFILVDFSPSSVTLHTLIIGCVEVFYVDPRKASDHDSGS